MIDAKAFAQHIDTSRISPQTSHILDATRAIAAGLVVLFHSKIYTFGSVPLTPVYQWLYAPANCGSSAVMWFFVISGYLVGGAVVAEVAQTGSFDFKRYLISRMTRLYIVLIPALALGALLDGTRIAVWGMNAHAGFETVTSLSATTFFGNLLFLQTIVVQSFGSNWALWSLANEFWYYLTFPLLFAPMMFKQSILRRAMLFVLGAGLLLFIGARNPSIPWLFTLWLMGAAIRFIKVRPIKSKALAWGIAIAALLSFRYLHDRFGMLSTQMVGITFAIAVMQSRGQPLITNEFWIALAKRLSAFSFSLYLVHLPLLHFILTDVSGNSDPFLNFSPSSLSGLVLILTLVGVSYAVAFIFSLLTEKHTDDVRRRLLVNAAGKTSGVQG
jgi:peptidoglycan/LPS O-acetylase OafA/YrhL